MARKKKPAVAKKRKRILWTASDLKFLRQNAGKMSLSSIARALKRSSAAVQFKAWSAGLSTRKKK